MKLEEVKDALARVSYKQWEVTASERAGEVFLQVGFRADGERWTSRKWFLSRHATESEVIQTALKAVLTAEEHEVREHFLVDGYAAFGPHFDVDRLVELARDAWSRDVGERRQVAGLEDEA